MSKQQRTGTIYSEMTNKGRSSTRYIRGCKPIYCYRWVAEIKINGKRHRFRSTNEANCRTWLNDMIAKATPIVSGAASPNYHRDYTQK